MSSLIDWERVRAIVGLRGPEWRAALDELAAAPGLRERLARELSRRDPEGLSRREFLGLSGSALLLAGLAACRQPLEEIVPYLDRPEALKDRPDLVFASTLPRAGHGRGVLVRSFEGRPIKIDGNPSHPDSLGACDPYVQAELLTLYDPERSQAVLREGQPSTRASFLAELDAALRERGGAKGERVRLLTGAVTSPTLADEIKRLRARFPGLRWHAHEPAGREQVRAGARLAFGRDAEPRLRLDRASVLVGLDADLFFAEPAGFRLAREFASRRDPRLGRGMLRAYAAEPAPGLSGSVSDHRLPLRADRVEPLARRLAALAGAGPAVPALEGRAERWARAAAADLRRARGAGLVAAGPWQPPVVHAIVHAINAALGNAGRTVAYGEPPEAEADGGLAELAADAAAGRVGVLAIAGSNPAYDAPAGLGFADLLRRVPFTVHLGLYADETAAACRWHAPAAHPLESWGDWRASDGTASIQQPLIAPLYNGWTALELVGALAGEPDVSAHERLRRRWRGGAAELSFEPRWRRWVHDGVIPDTASPARALPARPIGSLPAAAPSASAYEVVFRPDHRLWDGRYADNAWLQELPDPITKITWDQSAWIAEPDAARLGVKNGDLLRLTVAGRSLEAPAWIVPGQAPGSIALALGGGRARGGSPPTGFSAYSVRPSGAWSAPADAARAAGRRDVACVHGHHRPEGRDPARATTLAAFLQDPRAAAGEGHDPGPEETLYGPPPTASEKYAWGMAVDLARCIGCNACVLACQAENNIPTVGRAEVLRGREMHWLRIDRYEEGTAEEPSAVQQPLACVHCENAPCEPVCPVEATTHSAEGLNEMVYNRCVGTRYCSNNCPYKVRRFNFFQYSDLNTESLKLGRNPDVTVRNRGVMEKCTYCVQRISAARIAAEREGRDVRDGEIVPACQAACPTQTIVFGNLLDRSSAVSKAVADPRGYRLLGELGTRPRTRHLARVWNPSPELGS